MGDRGDKSPQNLERETLIQIVPQILSYRYKMSVLWPLKYAKIRFRPGLCPGPRWGSSRRSPRPLSRLERGHPFPYGTPLDTDPPSALAMRPPRSPARSTPMITCTLRSGICYRKSVCLSSVTFVRPTQPVEIFVNDSTPFCTLAIHRPS